jgi:hypothetical protein
VTAPRTGPSPMAAEEYGCLDEYYPSEHIILEERTSASLAAGLRPLGRFDRSGASFFGPVLTSFTAVKQKGERLA